MCTFEGFSKNQSVYQVYTIRLRFYRIIPILVDGWLERIPQPMVQKRRKLVLEGIGVPSKTPVMERPPLRGGGGFRHVCIYIYIHIT